MLHEHDGRGRSCAHPSTEVSRSGRIDPVCDRIDCYVMARLFHLMGSLGLSWVVKIAPALRPHDGVAHFIFPAERIAQEKEIIPC